MKNAANAAKKLNALLRKIGEVEPPQLPGSDTPVGVLVMSMLLWESTADKAVAAYDRLLDSLVDFNDLRVCMPHETLELIGPRYPRALDRCQRLRAVLRNIYLREHAVSLDKIAAGGKRDAKKYVESLDGIVPYAAARVLLLSFDTHGIPVDDQLRIGLIDAEVSDASVEIPELATWLGTQVKAGEGAAVHHALQSWVDKSAGKSASTTERKPSPKKGGRKTALRS